MIALVFLCCFWYSFSCISAGGSLDCLVKIIYDGDMDAEPIYNVAKFEVLGTKIGVVSFSENPHNPFMRAGEIQDISNLPKLDKKSIVTILFPKSSSAEGRFDEICQCYKSGVQLNAEDEHKLLDGLEFQASNPKEGPLNDANEKIDGYKILKKIVFNLGNLQVFVQDKDPSIKSTWTKKKGHYTETFKFHQLLLLEGKFRKAKLIENSIYKDVEKRVLLIGAAIYMPKIGTSIDVQYADYVELKDGINTIKLYCIKSTVQA